MQTFNTLKLTILRPFAVIAALTLSVATVCHANVLYSVTTNAINVLDANTGALLNSFVPPALPQMAGGDGLASAGTLLYYTTIESSPIYVLNPLTGSVLNSFAGPISEIDALGYGTSSFGNTLFALDYTGNRLFWLNPGTGGVFLSSVLSFDAVGGIDFNTVRGTLYVSDTSGLIRELNPNNGSILNSFATGTFQTGLGFVGGRLFTAAQFGTTIQERDPVTGVVLNSWTSPGGSVGALAGSPVPEPSTIALLGVGLAATLPLKRRRHVRGSVH